MRASFPKSCLVLTGLVAAACEQGPTPEPVSSRSQAVELTDVAPELTVSSGNASAAKSGNASVVDPDLTVTDSDGGTLDGARVSIDSGYVQADDTLAFTSQHGITGSFNAANGVFSLAGNASAADYQDALRSVTFQTTGSGSRTISFSLGAGSLYSPATGHYYQ